MYDALCLIAHAQPEHQRRHALREERKILPTELWCGKMGNSRLAQHRFDALDRLLGERFVVHHGRIALYELEGIARSGLLADPSNDTLQALRQGVVDGGIERAHGAEEGRFVRDDVGHGASMQRPDGDNKGMERIIFPAHQVLQGLVDLHGDRHSIHCLVGSRRMASDAMDVHRKAIRIPQQHTWTKPDLPHWELRVDVQCQGGIDAFQYLSLLDQYLGSSGWLFLSRLQQKFQASTQRLLLFDQ